MTVNLKLQYSELVKDADVESKFKKIKVNVIIFYH